MDADDMVKTDIFSKLIACAELNHADCVYFNSELLDEEHIGSVRLRFDLPKDVEGNVFTGQDFFVLLMKNNTYAGALWRQFWNHESLEKSNVRFIEGHVFGDDSYFSIVSLLLANRCIYLNDVLHTYRRVGGTLSSNASLDKCITYFKIYCRLLEFWNNNNFPPDVNQAMDELLTMRLRNIIKLYIRNKNQISENDFEIGIERHLYNCLLYRGNFNKKFKISDNEMDKLTSADEIIVYGAGNYAIDVVMYLEDKSIKINAIAITRKQVNTTTFNNLPIYDINELEAEHGGAVIVMGVKNEDNRRDIIRELQRRNFDKIITLREAVSEGSC
jgi:hypothetical protein